MTDTDLPLTPRLQAALRWGPRPGQPDYRVLARIETALIAAGMTDADIVGSLSTVEWIAHMRRNTPQYLRSDLARLRRKGVAPVRLGPVEVAWNIMQTLPANTQRLLVSHAPADRRHGALLAARAGVRMEVIATLLAAEPLPTARQVARWAAWSAANSVQQG